MHRRKAMENKVSIIHKMKGYKKNIMGHVHVKVRRIKVIRDMFASKIVFT